MKPITITQEVAPGVQQSFQAIEVEFDPKEEPWMEYKLRDSNIKVRIKSPAVKIYRVLNAEGKPAFNQDGSPAIVVTTQLLVAASEVGIND